MTTEQQTRDLFWLLREEMVARHRAEMAQLNKQENAALDAFKQEKKT